MFWEAIEVSCTANAQMVCLAATGSLAVKLGLIDRPRSRDLSRLAVVEAELVTRLEVQSNR